MAFGLWFVAACTDSAGSGQSQRLGEFDASTDAGGGSGASDLDDSEGGVDNGGEAERDGSPMGGSDSDEEPTGTDVDGSASDNADDMEGSDSVDDCVLDQAIAVLTTDLDSMLELAPWNSGQDGNYDCIHYACGYAVQGECGADGPLYIERGDGWCDPIDPDDPRVLINEALRTYYSRQSGSFITSSVLADVDSLDCGIEHFWPEVVVCNNERITEILCTGDAIDLIGDDELPPSCIQEPEYDRPAPADFATTLARKPWLYEWHPDYAFIGVDYVLEGRCANGNPFLEYGVSLADTVDLANPQMESPRFRRDVYSEETGAFLGTAYFGSINQTECEIGYWPAAVECGEVTNLRLHATGGALNVVGEGVSDDPCLLPIWGETSDFPAFDQVLADIAWSDEYDFRCDDAAALGTFVAAGGCGDNGPRFIVGGWSWEVQPSLEDLSQAILAGYMDYYDSNDGVFLATSYITDIVEPDCFSYQYWPMEIVCSDLTVTDVLCVSGMIVTDPEQCLIVDNGQDGPLPTLATVLVDGLWIDAKYDCTRSIDVSYAILGNCGNAPITFIENVFNWNWPGVTEVIDETLDSSPRIDTLYFDSNTGEYLGSRALSVETVDTCPEGYFEPGPIECTDRAVSQVLFACDGIRILLGSE